MTSGDHNIESISNTETPPGIIDTMGNAFALLNRRPYLIWLPIALDLMLWTGFRVSIVDPLSWATSRATGSSGILATSVDWARSSLAEFELTGGLAVLVPTLLTDLERSNVPGFSDAGEASVSGLPSLALLVLVVLFASLIGVTYLTMIGRLVADRPASGMRFGRDCIRNTGLVYGLVAAIALLAGFLFLPFVGLGIALDFIGFDPVVLFVTGGFAIAIWAAFFFFFSVHALALGVNGPLNAMRSSYQVVRTNLVSVMGLLLVVLLIRAGMPIALQIFTETPWSVPFAIVVSAYVSTGLIAATMLFYLERSTDVTYARPASLAARNTG